MLQEALQYGNLEDILKEAGISQEEFNEEEQHDLLLYFFTCGPHA